MDDMQQENNIEEFSNDNGRIFRGDALEVLQKLLYVSEGYGRSLLF